MALPGITKIPYLRKVFFFTHGLGLCAGLLFPIFTFPFFGDNVPIIPFFLACLGMGYATGACMYLFVRVTLKNQLGVQLQLLRPLTGKLQISDQTVEGMSESVRGAVQQVELLVQTIIGTIEELAPHHVAMSERNAYLSERAAEGLRAAANNHQIVKGMEDQYAHVAEQFDALSARTQDEAALSRELFSSLREMAEAMEHSNSKFIETSACVDQMASSAREVTAQTSDFSTRTARALTDLRAIEQALVLIREGATDGVSAAAAVRSDAENSLQVMDESIAEMDRIDSESKRATAAMHRLGEQTEEVTKIIEVIKDLVSDTELLAFNAAIIAAKAGAEGKGFSVVAGEIRDLADRTTASAQDIHTIITSIAAETKEVTTAVEATAATISRGKQLSMETGQALRKIMASAQTSSKSAQTISDQTVDQSARAHTLLDDVSHSLQAVQSIAHAMNEQMISIQRIQEGTNEMQTAADQITRGMEEQVRANREFDRGLAEREEQIQTVNTAVQNQKQDMKKIFELIAGSQSRLQKNKEMVERGELDIAEMEILSGRLKELADVFHQNKNALNQEGQD